MNVPTEPQLLPRHLPPLSCLGRSPRINSSSNYEPARAALPDEAKDQRTGRQGPQGPSSRAKTGLWGEAALVRACLLPDRKGPHGPSKSVGVLPLLGEHHLSRVLVSRCGQSQNTQEETTYHN